MKRFKFFFLFFLISTLSVMAQDDEKAAIIKVLEDEHKYAAERNLEKMAATFDQSENLLWGNGLRWSAKGWDTLSKLYKDHFTNNPDPQEPQEYYNYDITIAGNRAWVVFDKKDKGGSKAVSKELRILVKRGEEWKIAALLFKQTNYWGDTIAVSGSKGDQFIFSINGQTITTEEAEKMNKFFFSEHGVRMLREHHTSMFGHPMYLKAAGANLLPGVEKRKLFGAETLGITFSGLPNSYKHGGYNDGAVTLYVDPEKEYKLHAIYFDNGWGKDQKGMLMLFQGEIEEGGIRVPGRLLYFNASDLSFRHHVNAIKSVKSLE